MSIVVEDGTGLPNATSYVDVDYAVAYAAQYNKEFDADDDNSLAVASQSLDLIYGKLYRGTQLTPEQGLRFPRTSFIDGNGFSRDGIPVELMKATVEAAILTQSGVVLVSNPSRDGVMTRKTSKVGDLEQTFEWADTATSTSELTQVTLMLSPLIQSNTTQGIQTVRLARG